MRILAKRLGSLCDFEWLSRYPQKLLKYFLLSGRLKYRNVKRTKTEMLIFSFEGSFAVLYPYNVKENLAY